MPALQAALRCLRAARGGVCASVDFDTFAQGKGLVRCFATAAASGSSGAQLMVDQSKIRNFAIIAHVDHGKTTLMDRILSCSGFSLESERAMDRNTLEKERGITILSKYTSLLYKQHLVNAVDTPGHADFSGEVERIMGMVDSCVLLVDAVEGPRTQTKFVLRKALERGFRPLVVLNKVDREAATPQRCGETASALFDLFASLGANDEQLDFPLLYASARQGWAAPSLPPPGSPPPQPSMEPLLDAVLRHVPPPAGRLDAPFALSVAMVEKDPYLGKLVTGRVATGRVRVGDPISVLHCQGPDQLAASQAGAQAATPPASSGGLSITRIIKLAGGFQRVFVDEAIAGDVVTLAGAAPARIPDTVAAPGVAAPLDPGPIDPPTLSIVFASNDSPLAGRAGKAVAARALGERLMSEAETSVSLKVGQVGASEKYEVRARGELQLGVLIETLRREGLEMQLSAPRVVMRQDAATGQLQEPYEEVIAEVDASAAGAIIDSMNQRKGELLDMAALPAGKQALRFLVPSRGMIGYKGVFTALTGGEGTLQRAFAHYGTHRGPLGQLRRGVIVSTATGTAKAHALEALESRGTFFIRPGDDVYAGMVVGESNKEGEVEVNPTREKHVTNVRSTVREELCRLAPPRVMSLEEIIGYVEPDELVEVTPAAVRLRKATLDANERRKQARRDEAKMVAYG